MRGLAAACASMLLAGFCAAAGSVGDAAADFSRKDLSGRPVHLADYRDKLVLLNFWATWCGPCLEEIPAFSRWQEQYGPRGLQVLGVSMDDDEKPVQRFLQKAAPSYPVIMGDAALAKPYGGVFGLPLTFLIDARGRIIARYLGVTDLDSLEAQVRQRLAP